MNYYPHHIGDFNSATRHLTRLERSVYRDMLDLYYDTERPLTLDMDGLCRLLIARSNEERTAVEQVLNEFFTETEQGWRHPRCDAEIERYINQIEAKSAAGKASAAKRAQKTQQSINSSSTDVQQPSNDCATNQNQNQNQEPIEKNTPKAPRKRGPSKSEVPELSAGDLQALGIPADVATEFLSLRKRKRAPLTEIALAGIRREADAIGWPLEQALRKCIERGWQGFDGSWVQNNVKSISNGVSRHGNFAAQDYRAGVAADGTF